MYAHTRMLIHVIGSAGGRKRFGRKARRVCGLRSRSRSGGSRGTRAAPTAATTAAARPGKPCSKARTGPRNARHTGNPTATEDQRSRRYGAIALGHLSAAASARSLHGPSVPNATPTPQPSVAHQPPNRAPTLMYRHDPPPPPPVRSGLALDTMLSTLKHDYQYPYRHYQYPYRHYQYPYRHYQYP
jgi:hypothetical protein